MIVYASFRPSDRPIKLVKLQIFAKKCSAVFQVILEYIYNYITVIGGEWIIIHQHWSTPIYQHSS